MNLLLDTHTFLWFAGREQARNLPQPTKELLESEANELFLSLASVWELAIKVAIGKINLAEPVIQLVEFHVVHNGIRLLPITLPHLNAVETLPLHHRDPFDRLLLAQGQFEHFALVSADPMFDQYGIQRIWLT